MGCGPSTPQHGEDRPSEAKRDACYDSESSEEGGPKLRRVETMTTQGGGGRRMRDRFQGSNANSRPTTPVASGVFDTNATVLHPSAVPPSPAAPAQQPAPAQPPPPPPPQTSTAPEAASADVAPPLPSSSPKFGLPFTWLPGGQKKRYQMRAAPFVVDARYDVLKVVGAGAYGVVCSAMDTVTGGRVAIKKIPRLFDDLVDGKRVLREIKVLRALGQHPNIVQLHEVLAPYESVDAFSDVYLVTNLMDCSLAHLLKGTGASNLGFAHYTYLIFQLLCALGKVHAAGIVHRDVKPANLLVNANCDLRLCDFGLARPGFGVPRGRSDLAGSVLLPPRAAAEASHFEGHDLTDYVVTRWYRPPEILLMVHNYSHSADLWSAGCVAAELVLRRPLFQGRDYMHQLREIASLVQVPARSDAEAVESLPGLTPERVRFLRKLCDESSSSDSHRGASDQRLRDHLSIEMERVAAMSTNGVAAAPTDHEKRHVIDFVAGLLRFAPDARLTALEGIQHEYFAKVRASVWAVEQQRSRDASQTAIVGPLATSVPMTAATDECEGWAFDRRGVTAAELRAAFWFEMTGSPPPPLPRPASITTAAESSETVVIEM